MNINLFLRFCSLFILFILNLANAAGPLYEEPSQEELIKKYSFECYAEEKTDRDKSLKLFNKCKEIEDANKDNLDNLKGKIKQTWDNNCADGDWKRPRPFRPGIPESCTILGEIYMGKNDLQNAEKVLTRACGLYFSEKAYADDKQKVLERMQKYGCVTPTLAKKYDLKGIPTCSAERILGCLRLGDTFTKLEKQDEATKFYERACDGGEAVGCERVKGPKTSGDLLMYTSVLLIGLSVFLFTRMMFQDESQFKAGEQLEDTVSKDDVAKHGAILKYSRPFFKRYISPIVGTMKYKKVIKEKYRRPLAAGGLTAILTPEDFFSFKLFLIIGFPIVFMGVRTFLEESWSLGIMPVLSIVGYFYPDLWISGKKSQRQADVIAAMPFSVDMLALSVEAGLDFIAAMTKVVEKGRPTALTEEFQILIKEIKIGASRAEALRNMSWRIDLIQISSFCATLIAADSVGASIGPILKSLAGEVRQKKSSDIEKKGATAATKILFPMLFLITPAVLLIVAGPLVVEFVANGGN